MMLCSFSSIALGEGETNQSGYFEIQRIANTVTDKELAVELQQILTDIDNGKAFIIDTTSQDIPLPRLTVKSYSDGIKRNAFEYGTFYCQIYVHDFTFDGVKDYFCVKSNYVDVLTLTSAQFIDYPGDRKIQVVETYYTEVKPGYGASGEFYERDVFSY